MLPEFAADVQRFPTATHYWIEVHVTFDPLAQRAHLEGEERLLFTNPLALPLSDLVLMLWPNDPQYDSTMSAGAALVNGRQLEPGIELGGRALRYRLAEPLPPAGVLDVSLPFAINASGPIGGPDPKRFGVTQGVLLSPTFYPLVPRLQPDATWQAEIPAPGGDTTNSDIALYHVSITYPKELALAASGSEIDRRDNGDGTATAVEVTGPMRDFAFALGAFVADTRQVGDVTVRGWVIPEHQEDLAPLLEAAAQQVQVLDGDVGSYPYRELDVVDAPGAFGGIEYPGLVFIGTVGTNNMVIPTVHEVAHQWFYGLIGDDQLNQPWLDEAAATYCEVLYYEGTKREPQATGLLSDFRDWVRQGPDPNVPIGLPVGGYPSQRLYGLYVYIKGALFFDALRAQLGDADFLKFLQGYFQAYRYGFASADDFEALAEKACGCDLGAMFDLWVRKGGPVPGP
jgi:hypothetical protein